ncbi:hypothetical protein DFJ74DRAFT_639252 [Hyaloraphidium curvatum]|nr:hypothetical protein DFJ74DRAFT_639252 [Hyaloraphidium curvatum]
MKLQLLIRATLTNLTSLRLPPSAPYEFRVKCTSCNELHGVPVTLDPAEERDIGGSRGKANFVWKCGFCRRESSASFVPGSNGAYGKEEDGEWKGVAQFECRGLEFVEFVPGGGWLARSTESSTEFDEVDLSDPDAGYSDYDEKGKCEVAVMDFQSKLERAK